MKIYFLIKSHHSPMWVDEGSVPYSVSGTQHASILMSPPALSFFTASSASNHWLREERKWGGSCRKIFRSQVWSAICYSHKTPLARIQSQALPHSKKEEDTQFQLCARRKRNRVSGTHSIIFATTTNFNFLRNSLAWINEVTHLLIYSFQA